jgi:hypothetical protein
VAKAAGRKQHAEQVWAGQGLTIQLPHHIDRPHPRRFALLYIRKVIPGAGTRCAEPTDAAVERVGKVKSIKRGGFHVYVRGRNIRTMIIKRESVEKESNVEDPEGCRPV